jgi:hypothetical protein
MSMKYGLVLFALFTGAAHAQVADPWQYRGIHLGAKMTPDQIMHALGVDKYSTNPKQDDVMGPKHKDDLKHGLNWAMEKVEFDTGPRCMITNAQIFDCSDPEAGLHPSTPGGDNHGIVSVWVFVKNGVVHTIDLKFDSVRADEFFDVMFRQFGRRGWVQGRGDTHIAIIDLYDKTSIVVDRQILQRESAKYGARVTDYDLIFTHYMPMYQGSFEMNILDQHL